MRQDEIVVDLEQHQLLAQAVLMLAQRVDPTADRRHMLPEVEIEALYESGVDVPALRSQYLINGLQRAKHDAMVHPHQATAANDFNDLRVEQPGPWHPPGLERWPVGVAPCRLPPVSIGNSAKVTLRG